MQLGSRATGNSGPSNYQKPAASTTPHAPSQPREMPAEELPTINLEEEEEVKIEDVPF
jgi:hypothetical protein